MVLRKVKGILKKGAYVGLAAVILATSVQPAAVFARTAQNRRKQSKQSWRQSKPYPGMRLM